VKRLLLEGGGGTNGAFLRAGLVDELNLGVCPAVNGTKGAPSVFHSAESEADQRAPSTAMSLKNSQALQGGAVLLRYRIEKAPSDAIFKHAPSATRTHHCHRNRSRGDRPRELGVPAQMRQARDRSSCHPVPAEQFDTREYDAINEE
jgi:hypothetical protein